MATWDGYTIVSLYSNCTVQVELMMREAQGLWHGTTHVGMGKTRTSKGVTYVVARYWPPNNMVDQVAF